jgi:hypothetical protein
MVLDHNGFDLRYQPFFLDCGLVDHQIIKVVTGRPELPAYDSVPSGGTDIELPFGN